MLPQNILENSRNKISVLEFQYKSVRSQVKEVCLIYLWSNSFLVKFSKITDCSPATLLNLDTCKNMRI